MRVIALFFFATRLATAADPLPDGEYESVGRFKYGSQTISLTKGSFKTVITTDTSPDVFSDRGRYLIDGERLILLGDNPDFAEIFWFRTIDGVTVLMTQQAWTNLKKEKTLLVSATFGPSAFWPKNTMEADTAEAYRAFQKKHPNFPKLVPEPK